jgi:hypothetical protein
VLRLGVVLYIVTDVTEKSTASIFTAQTSHGGLLCEQRGPMENKKHSEDVTSTEGPLRVMCRGSPSENAPCS